MRLQHGMAWAFLGFSCVIASGSPVEADELRIGTTVSTTTGVIGYRPGSVGSLGGTENFDAAKEYRAGTVLSGTIFLFTDYIEATGSPYTVIPQDTYRVSMAGLEARGDVVVLPWLRLGLYHHSAHNFSYEKLGRGTSLNAFEFDLRAQPQTFVPSEEMEFRLVGRWFWPHPNLRNGSAYLMTPDSVFDPPSVGGVEWTSDAQMSYDTPVRKTLLNLGTMAEHAVPASVTLGARLLFRMTFADSLLGPFAEHLWVGPQAEWGMNFSRVGEFGSSAGWLGFRLEFHVDPR